MDKKDIENPIVEIPKPWGKEVLIAAAGGDANYAGQLMFMKGGQTIPPHFHSKRDKTLFLMGGHVRLSIGGYDFEMEPYKYYRVKPNDHVSITTITDSIIVVTSTMNLDDITYVRTDE